jgi:hypothetical protein
MSIKLIDDKIVSVISRYVRSSERYKRFHKSVAVYL